MIAWCRRTKSVFHTFHDSIVADATLHYLAPLCTSTQRTRRVLSAVVLFNKEHNLELTSIQGTSCGGLGTSISFDKSPVKRWVETRQQVFMSAVVAGFNKAQWTQSYKHTLCGLFEYIFAFNRNVWEPTICPQCNIVVGRLKVFNRSWHLIGTQLPRTDGGLMHLWTWHLLTYL